MSNSLLEVDSLSKTFGGVKAVSQASFTVETGEIRGIIGPNGAGKTTLLDLLTGFSRPDAGRILFEASDLLGIPPHRLPPLGVMRTFQATRLIRGLTVRENIMLGAHHLTRARFLAHGFRIPMARAEEKGLQARAEQILAFLDLEDVADNVATELAAGLQRMVVLGSALASGPRLLLLDEPAAGLNDTETLDLAEVLRAVRTGGTTVVLIEHNVNLVMDVCDRVLVLDAGRVIADAGPPQVQEDPAVRAAYLGEGA